MDGTLSLLANAARYQGLPSDITTNLALLTGKHLDVYHDGYLQRRTWNPQLDPQAPEYEVPSPGSRLFNRFMQNREAKTASQRAFIGFGEVIQMAESRGGISLGRVKPRAERVIRRSAGVIPR